MVRDDMAIDGDTVLIWLVIALGFLCLVGLMAALRRWIRKYPYLAFGGPLAASIQYSETFQMIADTVLLPFFFLRE
jgi:hypothetical protein